MESRTRLFDNNYVRGVVRNQPPAYEGDVSEFKLQVMIDHGGCAADSIVLLSQNPANFKRFAEAILDANVYDEHGESLRKKVRNY